MDSLPSDPVRPPRSSGRFVRRVRVGLIALLLVGWVSLAVVPGLDLPSFPGQEQITGKVLIAFGGLHLLLAGVSFSGRWRSGRLLEWLGRTLFCLQIVLVGLGLGLVGGTLVFRLAPRMVLPGLGLLGAAFFLTFTAQQIVVGRTLKRRAALRVSHRIFLAERARQHPGLGIGTEPGVTQNSAGANTWISQGQHWLEGQRFEEALTAFDRAVELDAHSAQAHLGQGLALSRLEAWADALTAYEQAWTLDPTLVEALARQASMHTVLGQAEAGLAVAREAIRIAPARWQTYATQGTALLRLQRYPAAVRSYWAAWRVARNASRLQTGSAA